jgi:hypothetical protein
MGFGVQPSTEGPPGHCEMVPDARPGRATWSLKRRTTGNRAPSAAASAWKRAARRSASAGPLPTAANPSMAAGGKPVASKTNAPAALSARRHVIWVEKPYERVLAVMPSMYDDLWTAAKGMYKIEPAIAGRRLRRDDRVARASARNVQLTEAEAGMMLLELAPH